MSDPLKLPGEAPEDPRAAPAAAPVPEREPAQPPVAANTPAAPEIPQPPTEINGVTATDDVPDFSERFAAAWRQRTVETDVFDYTGRVIGELRDELWEALPPEVQNRLTPEFEALDQKSSIYFDANAAKRQRIMDELAKTRTGEAHGAARHPTTEAEFLEMVDQRRRETYDQAGEVLAVDGPGVGGFLGGLSRDLVDPVNIALAPFGVQGGILRTFVAEGILGGVAGAASLPREFRVADELDLPRPDVLTRIGTEALASGVLGAGIVAVVRGARAFKNRGNATSATKPADMPDHVHEDAQAEAEARLRDQIPERDITPRDATGKKIEPPDFDFSVTGNASPRTNRVGYVFGKLLEHGLEPHVAAGFVGNFMVESTTSLQPSIRGDGGAAHGIAQWNDRAPALKAFARARGTDWTDLDTQIDFMMHELHTTEAGAWARIRQAKTAAEAAQLVSRYYERPGTPHMDRRVGYAQGVIDQYEGGTVPKGGSSAPMSYVPQTTRAGFTSDGQVRTAAGTRIDVKYEVVDASTLTRASGDLQPRDRSLGNSDEQISNMAATLDPALLMPAPTADRGAPIIGPDNIIESGNGRFGAITRAAEEHPDRMDAYRQQIEAAGFAIPDDVRTPVLVARRTSDLDAEARRRFVIEAQDSGVARMTPVERSRTEASALDPGTLARLDPGKPLDDVANAGFLRAALDRLPRTERNAFVTPEGRLNADGREAMERALFARAFNDPELLRRFTEADAAELKSLLDALFEASPAWARLVADVADGSVRPEFDITGHVLEAMRTIGAARKIAASDGLKTSNVLAELLDEVDLLEGAMSPLTRALVGKFWGSGRAAPKDEIAGFLTRYATEARKVGGTDGDMFAAPDVPDVLRAVDPDTFADLSETGAARGQSGAPAAQVDEVLPEGSFNEGALSEDAIEADAIAADDLRESIAAGGAGPIDRLMEMPIADRAALEAELKAAQNFKSLDEMMARAATNHAELDNEIAAAATATGVRQKSAPLKKRDRVDQKVRDKYAGDLNRITDVARGGVDVETPEQAEAFIAALSARYRVLDEGWNFTDVGYFDRKLTVVFDDGQLGEVQIWPPGMLDAKGAQGGHKLYAVSRDETVPLDVRTKADHDMRELYGQVREALPPSWQSALGDQAVSGSEAPSLSTTASRSSRETSGDPSSPRTSDGVTGAQDLSADSDSIEPGSGSNAGIDRSIRKNRIAGTSRQDLSAAPVENKPLPTDPRADLLADGDFAVPIEGGRTVMASELLDDLDGDQVLDTVISLCTTGGRNA